MTRTRHTRPGPTGLVCLLLACPGLVAAAPAIGILIDDLGWSAAAGRGALALDARIAVSVLPGTPHGALLAAEARASGRAVLLHQPLEASPGSGPLGPGAIWGHMGDARARAVLGRNLAELPGVVGFNNHMGSRLTASVRFMRLLIDALPRGLLVVDSRTTAATVLGREARALGRRTLERRVFLDAVPHSRAYVRDAFLRLVDRARTDGAALAIGHPHEATLGVLGEVLPTLAAHGVELVDLDTLERRTRGASVADQALADRSSQ